MQYQVIYPWLEACWHHLAGYIAQQRIPQALILYGRAGSGKLQLANVFAQALCCEDSLSSGLACGKCHSCQLFTAGTHPDFLFIEPQAAGKAIGIDMIRQLISKLSLKPQFQAQRIVLINSADSLNHAAANAFLKCLEEPNERTAFLLVVEHMAKLPATVISRCQKIDSGQANSDVAIEWLQQHRIEHSALLLHIAQGDPLLAKHYADLGMASIYHECFHDWLELAEGGANPVQLAEKWHKQDGVSLTVVFSWMLRWVITLVKQAYQQECLAENEKPLQVLSERLELGKVFHFYDLVLQAISLIDTTLNRPMLIEQIFIEWSRLTKR